MGKRKFYFFDLVYFVGERLNQLFPGRRSIDGVLLIPLGIMFLLGYCLNLLNITLLHFTGWKEKTVICVPILLSYIIRKTKCSCHSERSVLFRKTKRT